MLLGRTLFREMRLETWGSQRRWLLWQETLLVVGFVPLHGGE